MENQHRLITGYRDLDQTEIDLMNEGKELAETCGAWIARLEAMDSLDKRFLELGKADLQKGFMLALRSIAKPETF